MKIKLNELLDKKDKTRYWLSKETGITHQNLTKLGRGDTKLISLDNLEKICIALECTPNDILEIEKK